MNIFRAILTHVLEFDYTCSCKLVANWQEAKTFLIYTLGVLAILQTLTKKGKKKEKYHHLSVTLTIVKSFITLTLMILKNTQLAETERDWNNIVTSNTIMT